MSDQRDCFETSEPVQFSLRSFLIATCAVGLAAGLFGRLFFQNPRAFAITLSVLSTVGPFVLAVATILWLALRRKRTAPTLLCGCCRQKLSLDSDEPPASCPACSASLAGPGALVLLPGQRRRWGLAAWAILLLLTPAVGLIAARALQRSTVASPMNLQSQTTRQLINVQLPQQIDAPWVWDELELRLAAGTLTQLEVDDAVNTLVTHMTTTAPNGWDQPLSWQGKFIKAALDAGMISEPVLFDLCDAFFGPQPMIRPLPRVREGTSGFGVEIQYGSVWSNQSEIGQELLWQVDRVLLDGKPLEVRQVYKNAEGGSVYHDGSLPVGEYELAVEVECAYVDKAKLIGLDARELTKDRWPKARKRWKQTVSAPLKVYSADEPIVALATDAGRRPGPSGGLKVNRLVAQAGRDGRTKIILQAEFREGLPLPLSYEISIVINGQATRLGSTWVMEHDQGRSQGGTQLEAEINALDPSITAADIHLTPDPKPIENHPDAKEIWGEKTVLRTVPIERLDLEAGKSAQGP